MAKVTNLTIALQNDSDNTYFATWEFGEKATTTTTTSGVKKGSLVSIKSGATWYNGASIPSWVTSQKWYIVQINGDRAVLGQNESKTNNITSPINTKYLSGSSTTTTSSSTSDEAKTLDHYEVKWYYDTGDDVWFTGSSSDETRKLATYSPPANAIRIKVTVKPVSKKKKVNNKETSYWTGTSVSKTYSMKADPPTTPGTPDVEVEKFKLTATVTLDSSEEKKPEKTDKIQFQIVYADSSKVFKTADVTVKLLQASYSCTLTAGGKYKVRARAININGTSKIYSDWSAPSAETITVPSAPAKISSCKALSETSVKLKWSSVSTAKSYEIEYTNKSKYFDISDQTTTVRTKEGVTTPEKIIEDLASGQEYFFRVRAINEQGESGWSPIKSVIIGKVPVAPTTWSSTTKAITGENVTLYWVHNSADSSTQTKAELEIDIGGTKTTETITTSTPEGEEEKTYSKVIKTSTYSEGTQIKWRVRTAGVTGKYGEWSIQRVVDIHAKPSQTISVTDVAGNAITSLTKFPFYVKVTTAPDTQTPIGYHITVTADEAYETVDNLGNTKFVNKGEAVYSKYFDVKTDLVLELSASNLDLADDILYRVTSVVAMDSGLTDTDSVSFRVRWDEVTYEPDAEIAIDEDALSAYIRPYCIDDEGNLISGITLSVYRREFDGSFTEIATGLNNTKFTTVIDPHPALDYARYRIVASTDATGAINYYDAPGYPVGGAATVIQWDEEWSEFDTDTGDAMEIPAQLGSTLKLPYNIKVSDKVNQDVALVDYIGRENPVTYYGTQVGFSSTWNVDIDKEDEDTLYALRRLARWMGDVYVREPSGTGYWATVKVSYNSSYDSLVIPVTLDITRVEGGV